MKDIREIIFDQKPKSVKKLQEAIENGKCGQHFNAFAAELAQPTAANFPDLKAVVTDNYFCDYSHMVLLGKKSLIIYPLSEITNVYRTNMLLGEEYDFGHFYLAVDHTDGISYHCCVVKSNVKSMKPLDDFVQYLRSVLAVKNTKTTEVK